MAHRSFFENVADRVPRLELEHHEADELEVHAVRRVLAPVGAHLERNVAGARARRAARERRLRLVAATTGASPTRGSGRRPPGRRSPQGPRRGCCYLPCSPTGTVEQQKPRPRRALPEHRRRPLRVGRSQPALPHFERRDCRDPPKATRAFRRRSAALLFRALRVRIYYHRRHLEITFFSDRFSENVQQNFCEFSANFLRIF